MHSLCLMVTPVFEQKNIIKVTVYSIQVTHFVYDQCTYMHFKSRLQFPSVQIDTLGIKQRCLFDVK